MKIFKSLLPLLVALSIGGVVEGAATTFRIMGGLNISGPSSDPASAKAGDIYYNPSTGKFRGYDGAWKGLGSGGGGIFSPSQNVVTNSGFETDLTNWTASGGSFARTTTAANLGSGTGAGEWDSSASSQTLKTDVYTTQPGLYTRPGTASCNIQGAGATHLLQVYNVTTSTVIGSSLITSATNYARTTVYFTWPGTNNDVVLRLISVASNEPDIFIDDCYLGDSSGFIQSTVAGVQATDWSLTPAITASGFGTPTSSAIYSRRLGDTLEIQGSFIAGTTTASIAYLQLPAGYIIDYSKINTATNQGMVGLSTTAISSNLPIFNQVSNSNGEILFVDGSTTDQIYFAYRGSSNQFVKDNGNTVWVSGNIISFQLKIPIAGWTSTNPPAPGQVGANIFISSQVTTLSSVISPNTFTTFSNSPALTLTPTVTGTYKVYSGIMANAATTQAVARIFNTSGGATLLEESDGIINVGGPNSVSVQSTYTLIAGITYVFDIQGKSPSSNLFDLDGSTAPFYVKAELILPAPSSISGSFAQSYFDPTVSWANGGGAWSDGTASGTPNLVSRQANGITLTAAAGNVCGITFTPDSINSKYLINVTVGVYPGAAPTGNISVRLTDGTNELSTAAFAQQNYAIPAATAGGNVSMSSVFIPNSTSPVTLKIQLWGASSGSITAMGNASNAVEWSIIRIF